MIFIILSQSLYIGFVLRLSNCVGLNNYRFFYCFLLWTSIATLYLASLTAAKVVDFSSMKYVQKAYFKVSEPIVENKSIYTEIFGVLNNHTKNGDSPFNPNLENSENR